MRIAVVVAPPVVVAIAAVGGDELLQQFFQILEHAGFVFDGRERGGRAGDEERREAAADFMATERFFDFGGDIDDVAVALGLLADRGGVDLHQGNISPLRSLNKFPHFVQRLIDLGRVLAARLGEVGTAAPAAADDRRDLFDDVACMEARGKIWGNTRDKSYICWSGVCEKNKATTQTLL